MLRFSPVPRFTRLVPGLLIAVAIVASSTGCKSLTSIDASFPNVTDTAAVYAINGSPAGSPTAISLFSGLVMRADQGFQFDLAFDINSAGKAVLIPSRALASQFSTPYSVGLQVLSGAFATIDRAPKDGYVADVHVKVIGTRNPDFVSGETDLRGVFVADTIQGATTVIAEAGAGRYAFYRGTLELGPPPAAEAKPPAPPDASRPAGQAEQLLKGLNESNGAIQQMQGEQLQKLYKRNKQGVQAMEAY